LEKRCVRCHSADKANASLRLDSVAGIRAGGDSGAAVDLEAVENSLILQAVTGTGDVSEMPAEGEKLSADEIGILRQWITAGAIGPDEGSTPTRRTSTHWSFQPVVRSAPPVLADRGWARTAVDSFILARLNHEGIAPSPEADRPTLIRRLSLDLTGLLPAPAEVDAFVSDRRPDAYERLVDRLLASPRYGERWGRRWLDAARYADSNGYTIDGSRSIWKYRDWVIAAVNADMSFDQFTIEQVAGDMLPGSEVSQVIATGFHRNTLKNEEGGTDQEQFRVESVVDRVDTTGQVFLGLTLGCARCHDHKYDPISQRDYYELFALLNNAEEPSLQVPTDQQSKELPALATEVAQVEKQLADLDSAIASRQADWEARITRMDLDVAWQPATPVGLKTAHGVELTPLEDGSVLAGGKLPPSDEYHAELAPVGHPMTAVRLECLTHDSLPNRGPGLASNGNFVLAELRLFRSGVEGSSPSPVAIATAQADHSQEKYPVTDAIDGKNGTGWAINVSEGSLNVDRIAVFVLQEEVSLSEGERLFVQMLFENGGSQYLLGRFRLSLTAAPKETLALSESTRAVLGKPADQRTDAERAALAEEFKRVDRERIPFVSKIADLKQRQDQLSKSITTTLVMRERPTPRETYVHLRGDFLRPGARVQPDVPDVLPPMNAPDGAPDRLDLAHWLVSPENPLTPRVTVNRAWQLFFGRGLVETENDFGTQGSPPSHPELLDYLASELVRQEWSIKALHRLIVTSAVYRQSSHGRPDLVEKDPANRLLARQTRLRLEAEAIRDVALSASGQLSGEMGGPGVYPPQPEGIYRFTQNVKYWGTSQGGDRYRRAMYTYLWRSSPYPLFPTFDAPDGTVACTRRPRSNTPLQALTLANDPAFLELAQALGRRIEREAPDADDARLVHAFKIAVGRAPTPRELVRLAQYLAVERERMSGQQPPAGAIGPSDPAWASVARVLLNLDEFITRE
jgi:hypothetical protein